MKHCLLVNLFTLSISLSLGLVLPLSPLTVYAEETDPATTDDTIAEPVFVPIDPGPISDVPSPAYPFDDDDHIMVEDNNAVFFQDELEKDPNIDFALRSFWDNNTESPDDIQYVLDHFGALNLVVPSDTPFARTGNQVIILGTQPEEDTAIIDPALQDQTDELEPQDVEPELFQPAPPDEELENELNTPISRLSQPAASRTFATLFGPGAGNKDDGASSELANLDKGPARKVSSNLTAYEKVLREKLADPGADIRLTLSRVDLAALVGEKFIDADNDKTCDDGEQLINDETEVFRNGFCDPPRVDIRLIALLDYLMRPRREGGAGREYLEIKRLVSFDSSAADDEQYSGKPEPYTDSNRNDQWDRGEEYEDWNKNGQWDAEVEGTDNLHFVDITQRPNTTNSTISKAMDISAIDRIRVTTRIRRVGLFSSSNRYRYQRPIPIKVAWQSDEGIDREPLPAISVQEILQELTTDNLLDVFDLNGLLDDPSFAGRPLESLSTEDLATFLGGRLLQSLLDGQNIANFNFGDTIRDFGLLALAGSLNIDPEVIRNAHSLEEITELQGRVYISDKLSLEGILAGDTPSELLKGVARGYIAGRLGVKGYVLDDYATPDEFKIKLGQGLIEQRLPVPEHSFDGDSLDTVRQAMGGRYQIVFRDINTTTGQEQAAQIDERLEIPYGSTEQLLRGSKNLTDYKKQVGLGVWNHQIYPNFSDDPNQAGSASAYVPVHPHVAMLPLVDTTEADPTDGDTSLYRIFNEQNVNASLTAELLDSLRTENNGAVVDTVRTVIDAIRNNLTTLAGEIGAAANNRPYTNSFTNQDTLAGQTAVGPYTDPVTNVAARAEFLGTDNSRVNDYISRLEGQIDAISRAGEDIMELTQSFDAAAEPDSDQADSLSQLDTAISSLFAQNTALIDNAVAILATYRDSGQNVDGTSQQRDRMWGLPGGTWYAIIGGNINRDNFQAALVAAGAQILSAKLPTSPRERAAFKAALIDNAAGRAVSFTPTSPSHDYLVDVFLTQHPINEFRRLGRRLLLQSLQDSAEADSLGVTGAIAEAANTVAFYADRIEIIRASINIIRDELAALGEDLPADLLANLNALDQTFSVNPDNVTISAAQGIVRLNRNQLYTVIDAAQGNASYESVERLRQAARSLERATMEVMEGRDVTFDSIVPGNAENLETGVNIDDMFGGDPFLRDAAFESIGGLAGGNLDLNAVLTRLGMRKLSRLFELPAESLNIFQGWYSAGQNLGVEDLFIAVGAAQAGTRANDINDQNRESLADAGRRYVGRVSLPALFDRLNIELPDWLTPEDLANLLLGDPTRVLIGLGGTQIEQRLNLPNGFVGRVIFPAGANEDERETNREQAIIETLLGMMGVELDLPPGFRLTENPMASMGQARVETILGLPSGTLASPPQQLATTLSPALATDRATDEAVSRSLERFLNLFGVRLSTETIRAKRDLQRTDRDTDEYLAALATYTELLNQHLAAILTNGPLPGDEAASRSNSYRTRLRYLDNRIGLDNDGDDSTRLGTMQRWLTGDLTTDQLISVAGERSAQVLGATAFGAFLDRLGVSGTVFDTLRGRSEELVDLFRQDSWNNDQFATVYGILSQAFSFNLDNNFGLEQGTVVEMIRHPNIASALMIDQGSRFFVEDVLGIDLGSLNRPQSQIKQILQRVIIGGFYNPATGTFQPFNGFHGDQAIMGAIDELTNIGLEELNNLIPEDQRQWFRIPLSITRNYVTGQLSDRGMQTAYVGHASVAQRALSLANEAAEREAEAQRVRNTGLATLNAAALNTPNNGNNSSLYYNQLDQFTNQDVGTQLNANVRLSPATIESLESAFGDTTSAAGSSPNIAPPPDYPLDQSAIEAAQTANTAAAGQVEQADQAATAAGNQQNRVQETRHFVGIGLEQVAREYGYALADLGLNEIFGEGIIAPGLTRALINGTPESRTNALLYIGSNWIVREYGSDALGDLSFLVNFESLSEMTFFFDNLLSGDQQTAFGRVLSDPDGILSHVQNDLLTDSFWKDLNLKPGTLAALFSFALTGNLNSHTIGGFQVTGLADLYNNDWVITTSFKFVERWLGMKEGSLAKPFQMTYELGTALVTYLNLSSLQTALDEQISVVRATLGDSVVGYTDQEILDNFGDMFDKLDETAKKFNDAGGTTKVSQSYDQLVTLGIALGIYLLGLAVGEELAVFERAIGLPPGTILQATSLALTAMLVGMGTTFFIGLGIFLITTLLGFGHTKISTSATADGYFPYVGKLGRFASPHDPSTGNVPYSQWPSADILDNTGNAISSRALGEFDPTDARKKADGFKAAAQAKVRGLIIDLLTITERNLAVGNLNINDVDRNGDYITNALIPTQILVHQVTDVTGDDLYLDDPLIADLTREKRPNLDNTGDRSYLNWQWGVYSRPEYWDVVHVSY